MISCDVAPKITYVIKMKESTVTWTMVGGWIYKALDVVSNFFKNSGGEGAHIKIAENHEIKGESVQAVLGRKVHFEVVRAYASFPNLKTYGLENILKINIESAELDNIREELTGKRTAPNGKFFFIVVAVRRITPKDIGRF